jgi:ABC-type tungstate transport system substrate-binding protein
MLAVRKNFITLSIVVGSLTFDVYQAFYISRKCEHALKVSFTRSSIQHSALQIARCKCCMKTLAAAAFGRIIAELKS